MRFLWHGSYAFRGKRAFFHRARRPTGDELTRLLDSLSHRIAIGLHAATVCEAWRRRLSEHGGLRAEPAMEGVRFRRRRRSAPGMPIPRASSLVDVTISACGGKLRVIACIEDPPLITKILGHVRQRERLIDRTPRAPPDSLPSLNPT